MRWWARPSWRLIGQLLSDVVAVAFIIVLWLVRPHIDSFIKGFATPSRVVAERTGMLHDNVSDVASTVNDWPFIGKAARVPFDAMAKQLSAISDSAYDQVATIEQVAWVTSWVVFAVLLLVVLVVWLPNRLKYLHLTHHTAAIARDPHGDDLLALRALTTQPLNKLRKVDQNPATAWRNGDQDAITKLAELELKRVGIKSPAQKKNKRRSTTVGM